MLIVLPDGRELGLEPDLGSQNANEPTPNLSASKQDSWFIKLPRANRLTKANSAALDYYFGRHLDPHQKIDPHKAHRCVRDYPWVCPYMAAGGSAPCISKQARHRHELVSLELTNWERREGFQVEGSQLTLFYKGYWHNVNTGKEYWDNRPRPYNLVDVVCKPFGVASMEWLIRQCDFEALKWRILPLTETQADIDWINAQQVKHSGKFSACVFDIFD
jgi:hypothetical protein